MDILLNISRSKWNQAMKFGQFIEYKRIQKYPKSVYKKSKLVISLDQHSEMLSNLFVFFISKSSSTKIY